MYKQLLLQDGVRVRFVHGDVENPDSDSGFMQDNMQEMLSEWYSRKIANETLRGCKENAQTVDPETGYVYQNGGSAQFWLRQKKAELRHLLAPLNAGQPVTSLSSRPTQKPLAKQFTGLFCSAEGERSRL